MLVAILGLGLDVLPERTGWLAVASLLAIVVFSVTAAFTLGPVLWVEAVVLLAVISLWLADLAMLFSSRAAVGATV